MYKKETGLIVTKNELSYENVYLTSEGKELNFTEFNRDKKIGIMLEGVDGLKRWNGFRRIFKYHFDCWQSAGNQ